MPDRKYRPGESDGTMPIARLNRHSKEGAVGSLSIRAPTPTTPSPSSRCVFAISERQPGRRTTSSSKKATRSWETKRIAKFR